MNELNKQEEGATIYWIVLFNKKYSIEAGENL